MTPKEKESIIKGFTKLINGQHIIDFKIRTECKEIEITCPGDKVRRFKPGEKTVSIEVIYA